MRRGALLLLPPLRLPALSSLRGVASRAAAVAATRVSVVLHEEAGELLFFSHFSRCGGGGFWGFFVRLTR